VKATAARRAERKYLGSSSEAGLPAFEFWARKPKRPEKDDKKEKEKEKRKKKKKEEEKKGKKQKKKH